MRNLISLAVMAAIPVFASEDGTMQISSDYADYHMGNMLLEGNVSLDHDLGHIDADKIVLLAGPPERKVRFSEFHLEDHIRILFNGGGALTCMKAQIDYLDQRGYFNGKPDDEFVLYTDMSQEKGDEGKLSISLKSKGMAVKFLKKSVKNDHSSLTYISEITADKSVTVQYNNSIDVSAEHALYKRSPSSFLPDSANPKGVVDLWSSDKNGSCKIKSAYGDVISAQNISIDTEKRLLFLTLPRGSISTNREGIPLDKVEFSSGKLNWDEENNLLTLQERVVVTQKGIGTLKSEDTVNVYHEEVEGRKKVQQIEALGKTILNRKENEPHLSHNLVGYGCLIVDHRSLETRIKSPENALAMRKQVFFKDYIGEIYADTVKIVYELRGREILPKYLYMAGNVQIFNRYNGIPETSGRLVQYALADFVEYDPNTKEMTFAGSQEKRVLFFDKIHNLQVSAPGLTIKRDKVTNKDSIVGKGDVRFSFAENEFEELRKRFQFHHKEKRKSGRNDEDVQEEI